MIEALLYIGRWFRVHTTFWRTFPQPCKVLPPSCHCNRVLKRPFYSCFGMVRGLGRPANSMNVLIKPETQSPAKQRHLFILCDCQKKIKSPVEDNIVQNLYYFSYIVHNLYHEVHLFTILHYCEHWMYGSGTCEFMVESERFGKYLHLQAVCLLSLNMTIVKKLNSWGHKISILVVI